MAMFGKKKEEENNIGGMPSSLDTMNAINEQKQQQQAEEEDELAAHLDEDWEVQNDRTIELPESAFGPFLKYIKDEDITDIDYNGTDVWLTSRSNKRTKLTHEECPVDGKFAIQFAKTISNHTGVEFNQLHPVLEGETKELRASIVHPIVSRTGVSICIRKTPPRQQIQELRSIQQNYASREIFALLANCVKAHMNMVICGMPKAGKTELGKLISTYIPDKERVITIEDVLEWRYRELKPAADSLEWQTFNDVDFTDLIVASLKQNPTWVMIAETRGEEVRELINGFSTGVHGMTTLHTDDVTKIPMRMVNMVNDTSAEKRFLNNIYEFIDVGIFVTIKEDENGDFYRRIEQIGFFSAENDSNVCIQQVVDGRIVELAQPPQYILNKFAKGEVDNIFQNDELDRRLKEQGMEEIPEPACYIYSSNYKVASNQVEDKLKNMPTNLNIKLTSNKKSASSNFSFDGETTEEKISKYMNN